MVLERSDGRDTRIQATAVGSGAAELLQDATNRLAAADMDRLVGEIVSTFDRTVYVSLPVSTGSEAPPLVAIGTAGLRDGPLLVHTDTPVGFSFRDRLGRAGCECIASRRGAGGGLTDLCLQLNGSLLVDVSGSLLSSPPASGGRPERCVVREFGAESSRVTTRRELVAWLAATGIEDGLGMIDQLAARQCGDPAPQVDELVAAWVTVLTATSEEFALPESLVALLGRGPGATPSGDDVLIGLLLVCLAIDDEGTNRRVRRLAATLLAAATDRTTQISTALLAQAARQRAASPAIECLQRLLDGDTTTTELRSAATTLVESGHRSGADTLAGMLVASTAVLPELAARTASEE